MTLLQPAALAFAALAPVIVVLYLFKLRRQPAQVSTLMFWQRVAADHRRRALFQRLRQILSLLLQLLIFALLLLALARPECRRFRGGAVIVLDCRARMQARGDDGRPRFDAARNVAESYLRRASVDEPAALLAVEFSPRAAVGFSTDEKPLLDGLRTLRASDAGGDIQDAIRAAHDLLAARGRGGRIVLVTDQAPEGLPSDPELELQLVGAGKPPENVGITRLTARPLPNSPGTDEVLLELENFGASRQSGSVELSYDGALIDVKPFDLAPGERHTEIYPTLAADRGLANARGWLSAHLAHADAYPLDDDAYAVISPPRPRRTLLVSAGNLYLESLLKADADLRYDLLAPAEFNAAQAATFDAVILDDFLPPGLERADRLPAGNFLFLKQTPFNVPGAPPRNQPVVTEQDHVNPLLRLVDLRDVLFFRANAIAPPVDLPGWRFTAPARALDQPLVIAGERPGQRVAAFAFGATDSELPLRVAFPLLIHNTLSWLASHDDATEDISRRAGESVSLPVGAAVWARAQRSFAPLPASISAAEWTRDTWQPARNGFYLLRDSDGRERWAPVNTGDRAMSMFSAAPLAAAPPAVHFPVWPPWIYLALAAFALCLGEWWSFHRRRTE